MGPALAGEAWRGGWGSVSWSSCLRQWTHPEPSACPEHARATWRRTLGARRVVAGRPQAMGVCDSRPKARDLVTLPGRLRGELGGPGPQSAEDGTGWRVQPREHFPLRRGSHPPSWRWVQLVPPHSGQGALLPRRGVSDDSTPQQLPAVLPGPVPPGLDIALPTPHRSLSHRLPCSQSASVA